MKKRFVYLPLGTALAIVKALDAASSGLRLDPKYRREVKRLSDALSLAPNFEESIDWQPFDPDNEDTWPDELEGEFVLIRAWDEDEEEYFTATGYFSEKFRCFELTAPATAAYKQYFTVTEWAMFPRIYDGYEPPVVTNE